MRLNKRLYDAIVVSDEIDRTHSGAVRIQIIGVTDDLEDLSQPLALPSLNSMMAVPTKGSYLKVYFEEGDIHQPVYLQVSPQASFLPEEYLEDYPNKAVTNLGSDLFQLVHDRAKKTTVITHDSDSTLTWDKFGKLTHESDRGFDNSGFGAKDGHGKKVHPVLTEGTVDIFCCTPHSGGSEYLEVTHLSKATAQGTTEKKDREAQKNSLDTEGTGLESPETRPLGGSEVEYVQAKNQLQIPNRKVKYLLIGNTGKESFADSVNTLLNSSVSTHYVVGRTIPELIQMTELDKASTYASKGTWKQENNINRVSISVLLCGAAKSTYTDEQYTNLNTIIQHVRERYGSDVEVVLISEVDTSSSSLFGTGFDRSKV